MAYRIHVSRESSVYLSVRYFVTSYESSTVQRFSLAISNFLRGGEFPPKIMANNVIIIVVTIIMIKNPLLNWFKNFKTFD